MVGAHFWGKIFFDQKKWHFLHIKWCFSASTSRLHYLLRLRCLHPVRPCTGSVIAVWLSQATTFLFLSIIAFLRTRLTWPRTVFSTVGCVNLFLCLMCIHLVMVHICSHVDTVVITEHNFLTNHVKLSNKALPLESVMSSMYVFTQFWWDLWILYIWEYSPPRIILNIDDTPVVSRSHTHPSHSQTSRLLTSSLSLGVPVPPTTLVVTSFLPAVDCSVSSSSTWTDETDGTTEIITHLILVWFTSNFVHLPPLPRLTECVSRFGMTWIFPP